MKMKENGRLSARHYRAIEALLTSRNSPEAARKVGIGETTLGRWMALPNFDQAYAEARMQLLDDTVRMLQAAANEAVETLVNAMRGAAKIESRIAASRSVLEFWLRSRNELEIEARLSELEERMKPEVVLARRKKRRSAQACF